MEAAAPCKAKFLRLPRLGCGEMAGEPIASKTSTLSTGLLGDIPFMNNHFLRSTR